MFTVEQIKAEHAKVKSGADFPKYIQSIKQLGVTGFKTYVSDSHTEYFGANNFKTESQPMYDNKLVSSNLNRDKFEIKLKKHQQGNTDYLTFCQDCADNGVDFWLVDLGQMTCTYFSHNGEEVLVEKIPN